MVALMTNTPAQSHPLRRGEKLNRDGRAAHVVVERLPEDLGKEYLITLTLDGERIGRLRPGESVARDDQPGSHQLRAFNSLFWKTVAFDLAVGSSIRFVTRNRENFFTIFGVLMGSSFLSVVLERRASDSKGNDGSDRILPNP
jgi:hypothetical protein